MELPHLFFSFNGRINRLAYWLGSVLVAVVSLLVWTMANVTAAQGKMAMAMAAGPAAQGAASILVGLAASLLLLLAADAVVIWMGLAVSVKRWHDRGKSGWWVLMSFLPIVGWVWTFIECGVLSGDPGANLFGPSPNPIPVVSTVE